MIQPAATPLVVGMCAVAALVTFVLVRYLVGRRGPTLRAKLVVLCVGFVGVELATLPALCAAFLAEALLDLRESDRDHWIAIAVYAALTLYVIARLFPWREIEALATDPDASLADILRHIRDGSA